MQSKVHRNQVHAFSQLGSSRSTKHLYDSGIRVLSRGRNETSKYVSQFEITNNFSTDCKNQNTPTKFITDLVFRTLNVDINENK